LSSGVNISFLLKVSTRPENAASRFILKYKPTQTQISFLLAHRGADENEAEELIRVQMMEALAHMLLF
jgi:hypothetical protein